jgi:hypothetical protein
VEYVGEQALPLANGTARIAPHQLRLRGTWPRLISGTAARIHPAAYPSIGVTSCMQPWVYSCDSGPFGPWFRHRYAGCWIRTSENPYLPRTLVNKVTARLPARPWKLFRGAAIERCGSAAWSPLPPPQARRPRRLSPTADAAWHRRLPARCAGTLPLITPVSTQDAY